MHTPTGNKIYTTDKYFLIEEKKSHLFANIDLMTRKL